MKSLDSSLNAEMHVELDLLADTSVVGSDVLIVLDHECHADIYGYETKSRH